MERKTKLVLPSYRYLVEHLIRCNKPLTKQSISVFILIRCLFFVYKNLVIFLIVYLIFRQLKRMNYLSIGWE
jgi:hypothetical protein